MARGVAHFGEFEEFFQGSLVSSLLVAKRCKWKSHSSKEKAERNARARHPNRREGE